VVVGRVALLHVVDAVGRYAGMQVCMYEVVVVAVVVLLLVVAVVVMVGRRRWATQRHRREPWLVG
jgi:uncharacterized membrane protein